MEAPLLINTELYNPIDSHKTIDVLYFSIGKLKASPELKLYNKLFKPNMHIIQDSNISKHTLKKLFSFLKVTKVLYICDSNKLDEVTLRYIEAIAYLNTTNVVYDYRINLKSNYSYNSLEDKNNVSKLRVLLNSEIYTLKQALKIQREILTKHTFILKQNLDDILKNNIQCINKPKISVITSTNRNQNLNFYLNQMSNQKKVDIEVNLVTHGFEISKDKQLEYENKVDFPIKFIKAESTDSLGSCLNMAIEMSNYDVITKVDDDDFYLEYYLYDQWLAMNYSEAAVVGKSDGYYYFEEDDLIVRRNIGKYFKYDYFIMGATIMSRGDLMRKLKFSDLPRAVDSDFLRRVNERGEKIFIGHPFEMSVFRAADLEGHTWKVNDLAMLKSSEIVSFGNPISYVQLDKSL